MSPAVKVVVVLLLLVSCALQCALGHPGSGDAYAISSLEESSAELSPLRDAVYPQTIVSMESEGSFGSDIPRDPPLFLNDRKSIQEVNAREDIRDVAEGESRNFHPFDVALASRAIGRRIQEAIRQFSERFDLHFPEAHLPRYPPPGPFHHPPPPPPPPIGPFHLPPPPPHHPLSFHPPPPPFQDFPFQKPPRSPMPPSQHIPSPPPLFPFPPPRPELRPPPFVLHGPPPTMDSPPTPSDRPQQPTTTQTPPKNATDVWEILLPWWYPAHSRPPPTKPPKQPPQIVPGSNVTDVKEPTDAENVGGSTVEPANSTPPSFNGDKLPSEAVGEEMGGTEDPTTAESEVELFIVTEPGDASESTTENDDEVASTATTEKPADEQSSTVTSQVGGTTEKVAVDLEAVLTPLIGDPESGPNAETVTEASTITTEDESFAGEKEISTESMHESATTEIPAEVTDAEVTDAENATESNSSTTTEMKDEQTLSTMPSPDGDSPSRLEGSDENAGEEEESLSTTETMTSDATGSTTDPAVNGAGEVLEENEIL